MYISENSAVLKIKKYFKESGNPYIYKSKRNTEVTCHAIDDGIKVNCLGEASHKAFLPWGVFWHAVHIMLVNGGRASRGKALAGMLGSEELPFTSIEGHIASVIYGKQAGESVFMRISPVAHILIASGVCSKEPGYLNLMPCQQSHN